MAVLPCDPSPAVLARDEAPIIIPSVSVRLRSGLSENGQSIGSGPPVHATVRDVTEDQKPALMIRPGWPLSKPEVPRNLLDLRVFINDFFKFQLIHDDE